MLLYVPDWRMFYSVDAFRYDKEFCKLCIVVMNGQIEFCLHNITIKDYVEIKRELIHALYFELSSKYEWDISLLTMQNATDLTNSCP